jgi:hypothetical protein
MNNAIPEGCRTRVRLSPSRIGSSTMIVLMKRVHDLSLDMDAPCARLRARAGSAVG